jgi:hypothetical protein
MVQMIIRYGIGLIAANSAGQKEVWAKRDRAARIKKNMPAVEAAIAAHRADRNEVARQAEMQRIARELVSIQAEILALQAKQDAVNATVRVGNVHIASRYGA